jgi:hypothetical protein
MKVLNEQVSNVVFLWYNEWMLLASTFLDRGQLFLGELEEVYLSQKDGLLFSPVWSFAPYI